MKSTAVEKQTLTEANNIANQLYENRVTVKKLAARLSALQTDTSTLESKLANLVGVGNNLVTDNYFVSINKTTVRTTGVSWKSIATELVRAVHKFLDNQAASGVWSDKVATTHHKSFTKRFARLQKTFNNQYTRDVIEVMVQRARKSLLK